MLGLFWFGTSVLRRPFHTRFFGPLEFLFNYFYIYLYILVPTYPEYVTVTYGMLNLAPLILELQFLLLSSIYYFSVASACAYFGIKVRISFALKTAIG